jgi:hypothetical protein
MPWLDTALVKRRHGFIYKQLSHNLQPVAGSNARCRCASAVKGGMLLRGGAVVCARTVRGASWGPMVVYGRMQSGARIRYEGCGLFQSSVF